MKKEENIGWLKEMIIREEQELDYHKDRLKGFKEQLEDLKKTKSPSGLI